MDGLILGLIGGAVAGLATLVGALPILMKDSKFGKFLNNVNMDFVIGLMLSAAAFSLILPAYKQAYSEFILTEKSHELLLSSSALIAGAFFIKSVGKLIEKISSSRQSSAQSKKALMFVIAMMVHNFPEGLASGASMTLTGVQGYSLLGAISLQNIPEGFTTAISFLTLGLSPLTALFGVLMTGVVELAGGVIGGFLSHRIEGLLPLFMAFAGGAMMSVVLSELSEKLQKESFKVLVRPGFLSGVSLVLILNNIMFI